MSSTIVETPTDGRSAWTEFSWLIGMGAVFAGLLAGPAWWLAGSKGLTGLAFSAALCLIPGCAAVLVRVRGGSSATIVLVSIGLRLTFVMAGALAAKLLVTGYGMREFFIWLILFYLFTLAVETWFAFRRNSTTS